MKLNLYLKLFDFKIRMEVNLQTFKIPNTIKDKILKEPDGIEIEARFRGISKSVFENYLNYVYVQKSDRKLDSSETVDHIFKDNIRITENLKTKELYQTEKEKVHDPLFPQFVKDPNVKISFQKETTEKVFKLPSNPIMRRKKSRKSVIFERGFRIDLTRVVQSQSMSENQNPEVKYEIEVEVTDYSVIYDDTFAKVIYSMYKTLSKLVSEEIVPNSENVIVFTNKMLKGREIKLLDHTS